MENQNSQKSRNALNLAFWLNLLFSIIEIIGGILTNSTAIIADALHDFIDAVAIGVAVWMEKLSGKKPTSKSSYGYKRFSMLSALCMSLFLIIGAIFMISNAIGSFINPEEVHSIGMLWLAVLGIIINGVAFIRIKNGGKHSHQHSHHSHSHSHCDNHNSKAIMLHLLEDVLGWVAVLIGSLIIYFTNWFWIDGVLAIIIALYISYNALGNLIDIMKVLLQFVPENVDIEQLSQKLLKIDGVEDIHSLHIWSLDGNYNVGSVHAVIYEEGRAKENEVFLTMVQLLEKYQINHPTIQIEGVATNCKLADKWH